MKYTLLLLAFALAACTHSPAQLERQTSSWLGLVPDYDGPFQVNTPGFQRPSKVFLPKNYDTKDKWPLILLLHGYTSNPEQVSLITGMGKRVTSRGFILLTPAGTPMPFDHDEGSDHWNKGDLFWNATDFCCDFEKTNVDDVGYLLGLIKETSRQYHVDPERIYVFGHSNGGFMTNRLLCETDHVFAAAGTLAGATYKDPAKCRLQTPISYLQVHAENDPTVVFGENPYHAGGWGTVQQRVQISKCQGEPVTGEQVDWVFSIPGKDLTPITWSNCAEGTEVILWKLRAYDGRFHAPHHPWFYDVAGEALIDFFFRHTLTGK